MTLNWFGQAVIRLYLVNSSFLQVVWGETVETPPWK